MFQNIFTSHVGFENTLKSQLLNFRTYVLFFQGHILDLNVKLLSQSQLDLNVHIWRSHRILLDLNVHIEL